MVKCAIVGILTSQAGITVTVPTIVVEPLNDIAREKKPCRIFIGSMSDVCYWANEYVQKVLNVCKECPQHTFMFLTKEPSKIHDYMFFGLENVIMGLTITGAESKGELIGKYGDMSGFRRRFLSIEPLLGKPLAFPLAKYEHIIVGAMTGKKKTKPKKEWFYSIQDRNVNNNFVRVHYKKNITKYL